MFLLAALVCCVAAFKPVPSGWYQGSVGNLIFIQANIKSTNSGDVAILLYLPPFLPISHSGWTHMDLHDGELRVYPENGRLYIEVLPRGSSSHPAAPGIVEIFRPILDDIFPMKAVFDRFKDRINFTVGPFSITPKNEYDPNFLTKALNGSKVSTRIGDQLGDQDNLTPNA